MARQGGRDLAVGAMFALALVVVALAVMAVGEETGWFGDRVRYYVVFSQADGLLVGAPVKMSGVQIGSVSRIELPKDPTRMGIRVGLAVSPDYAPRVQSDSRAVMRILQLLTNEKFVEITPGTSGEALAEDADLERLEEAGVFERGELIAENLNDITVALKRILLPLQEGRGLIGQALQDPEFGKKGVEAMGAALENLEVLTDDILDGSGTVGRLLYDDELATKLDSLGQTMDDLSHILRAVRNREGAVGALLEDGGDAELALQDLRASAAGLRQVVDRLQSREGLIGRLLNDDEYSEGLATDLAQTLSGVAEIVHKINQGQGSLGAMVNDRALYDGAEDLVSGVNDSKFARWLTRRYRKKGIKAQDEAVGAEATP